MDERAEIILLERGPTSLLPTAAALSHWWSDPRSRQPAGADAGSVGASFNIEARVNHEVVKIDRPGKTVTVLDRTTGASYEETYDKLVLSPGAAPIVPPVPGRDLPGVFALRTIPDMDAIKTYVDEKRPHRAGVVGGGFIGIELAENLHRRGGEVTLVEMLNQVMAPLDYEMAAMVHQHMQFKHVRLALGDGLKAIEPKEGGWLSVVLQSERRADAEMVILSIGVRPENSLAQAAGLEWESGARLRPTSGCRLPTRTSTRSVMRPR
jgi:NADPH-dependent 2,4-dienoyl-CoA reductase/sulfur reductase-like enzyme